MLFAINPFTVTNVIDGRKCDLMDAEAYAIYSDNQRYVLSVVDVFAKFLHMIPIKTKSGPSIASAFRYTFDDTKYSRRRPIWL